MSVEGLDFDVVEAYLLQFLDTIACSFTLQYELENGERPLSDPGDHIGHLYHLENGTRVCVNIYSCQQSAAPQIHVEQPIRSHKYS